MTSCHATLCLVIFFLAHGCFCRIKISTEPLIVRLGSTLRIRCEIDDKRYEIMWFKDGNSNPFAENCLDFRTLREKFACSKNETFVELIFNSVDYGLRGNWSCSHGDQRASIEVNISVPLIVKTSVIELSLTDNRFPLATTSSVRGAGEPLSEDTFGQLLRLRHPTLASTRQLPVTMETTSKLHGSSDAIGTRANPIELTQGVHSVNIECSTNCVSQPTPLRWTIRNATILAEYETQAVSKAGCSDGLSSTISRATFACLLSPTGAGEVALLPSGHKPLPLVGLNRLTCAPGSLGLNLERSLLGLQSSPADALGSLADKDCTRNGQHSSACFFILCPGPPGPLLTYGEKVAVGLGTVLAVLMVVLLLRLLVVRRREKKVESAPIHDYPGELELML